MERRWPCGLWALLGALALAALAWLWLGRGDAAAQAVRERSQADAAQVLHAAGFGWVRLEIADEVGRLVGEAPSLPQRAAAFAAAGTLLMPMMGLPGVFARLEDGQTSPLPARPSVPAVSPPAAARPADQDRGQDQAQTQTLTAIADCEQAIARLLQAERIRFPSASAELAVDSLPLLRRLADRARRCPQAHIVVEGHTDARGDAAANLALSRRRAEAVVAALVRAGLPAERLEAQGLGETRLLDPSETPQAHERNRRIEFHLASAPTR